MKTIGCWQLAAMLAGAIPLARTAAQQAPALSPPAACLKSAKDWLASQVIAARAANAAAKGLTAAEIQEKDLAASRIAVRGAAKMAVDCAATFDLATIPATQLIDLIPLYDYAGDSTNSRLAFERMIVADLPPRAHGRALLFGMSREVRLADGRFGIIDSAERYVAMIDRLPDSLADLKLAAHRNMLGYYEYKDVTEGLRAHSLAVIDLGRKLTQPSDVLMGFAELARSLADHLEPDSALRVLDAAEKELGAPATARFKDFRNRYALLGTRAATLSAAWWINTDATSVVAPAPGKVTLIEFTAHWCGPCKNSYPGLNALAERLKGKDFQGVMVTQLYGYLGVQRSLTPAQEVAADRVYYGTENGLTFPVAISRAVEQPAGGGNVQSGPDTDYRVGGIPQIVIVDKRGVIRQIVTGWDQGNTERLGALIEQLMKEPVAPRP